PEPEAEEDGQGAPMTLVEHLEELRRRALIGLAAVAVGTIFGFIFWERILALLLTPLPDISRNLAQGATHQKLIQTHLGEAFLISLKISIATGIALASPVILYQLWAYLSPAFTRRERKYALPFTLLGVGLFVMGLSVGFLVLRYPVDWLINFGDKQFLLLLDANAYFSFVAFFLLAFGVVFELPLVVTFLGVVGVVSSQLLRQKRMYILFGLWFLSTIITPGADPYSPLIIGVSFTVLFEFSVILLRMLGK
ncbi:MAG: twin-arginine translocase subunit TatC, partial [Ktedonobacterales bacterium]|nr:twin-arginine translocase subunit TatC [Ktedonobacterales bacterium]